MRNISAGIHEIFIMLPKIGLIINKSIFYLLFVLQSNWFRWWRFNNITLLQSNVFLPWKNICVTKIYLDINTFCKIRLPFQDMENLQTVEEKMSKENLVIHLVHTFISILSSKSFYLFIFFFTDLFNVVILRNHRIKCNDTVQRRHNICSS